MILQGKIRIERIKKKELKMKNMKLSMKLIGGFGAVALITLIVGFIGWIGVSNSVDDLPEIE